MAELKTSLKPRWELRIIDCFYTYLVTYKLLQIKEANKGSKFEEEIKEEQEERKKAEEEKKSRQQQFRERAALFGGGS